MKYMLLIYHEEEIWNRHSEVERQAIYGEYRQIIQELNTGGKYVVGDQLQPATTASTVRVRDGKQLVTDGPFAETREQIGGFFVIEVNDLDEAQSIAARIPSARMGAIEIRPLVPPNRRSELPQRLGASEIENVRRDQKCRLA
jgi:hypothetical protein